ncbi:MAG: hypothetical protein ABR552_05905 [Actinomycetota bacterium]
MRFAVEAWAPDYGVAAETLTSENDEITATVECGIELPMREWRPLMPVAAVPSSTAFVDGIDRIDAQVWIEQDGGEVRPGLCATYAAGLVRCNGRALVESVEVRRGLFTASPGAREIRTPHVTYELRMSAGTIDQLGIAVVERMRQLEADVARAVTGADLIVLDGLLWGRTDVEHAIGYVKSHRAPYLPEEQNAVVGRLAPGQRTPVFLISTTWTRYSWYLRLPGGRGHPWAGVVRCEANPDLSPGDVVSLADLAAVTLPRFASASHKDPRAPQNLYPIAGLERELRRRSGDALLLYRGLRQSAAS